MNLKHKEIEVPVEAPFQNCKLNREQYALVLTEILDNQKDGFVLSVNNNWGDGKTTFIRMWKQFLQNKDFKTLYFNGWKNDFQEEVIIALLSELQELKSKAEGDFQTVLEKTATFMKKVAPIAAKGVVSKIIGDQTFEELAKATIEFTTEEIEELVNSFNEKKQGIEDFRFSLENFAKKVDNDKPVVFFIDELDRCRPDYAVRILEMVKHLFSVPGFVFVLAIDKSQLEASIKGFYGNEFDANEYLKRFIDLEFVIPRPSPKQAIDYYSIFFGFGDFYKTSSRQASRDLNYEFDNLKSVLRVLFSIKKMSLRSMEKIMAHLRIVCSTFSEKQYTLPEVSLLLIDIRDRQPNLYKKMENLEITPQELIQSIEDFYLLPSSLQKDDERVMSWTLGRFIYHYCYDYRYLVDIEEFIEVGEDGKRHIKLQTRVDQSTFQNTFLQRCGNYNLSDLGLKWLSHRVNLTSHLEKN